MNSTTSLLQSCYRKSIELLHANSTQHGIHAASTSPLARERNYTAIFARDAGICAMGVAQSHDDDLIRGVRDSLRSLAHYQADNGQIPNYVDAASDKADFWYVGCIDATLWWLVAVDYLHRHAPDAALSAELRGPVDKAIAWLRCQEHPQIRLLQQNEASDWADIMPRCGFVLYSNALWYRVKCLYGLPQADDTHRHFNQLFYPFAGAKSAHRRIRVMTEAARRAATDNGLYLSFVNFCYWGEEGDVFGNLLAVLFGLADEQAVQRIMACLRTAAIDSLYPVASVLTPITAQDPLWRPFMDRHNQNLMYQYHNGGIWPFLGGFWVVALVQAGERQRAATALEQMAAVNNLADWRFSEWLHGKSGEPRGMAGQSWNAATYLWAWYALERSVL